MQGVDNVLHQVLQWLCRRSKPGMKARYPWMLQELTLRNRPRSMSPSLWSPAARCWVSSRDRRVAPGWHRIWTPSEHDLHLFEQLRSCGVGVTVEWV